MKPTRLRHLASCALAPALALALAACGGGGDGGDPGQILGRTFSSDASISSGVLDARLVIESEGGSDPRRDVISVRGPFDGGGGGLPRLNVALGLTGEGGSGDSELELRVISTGDRAFVEYSGVAYEVPSSTLASLEQAFAGGRERNREQARRNSGLLDSLGIDPAAWLTGEQYEGTEEVGGVETEHVSGSVDVAPLFEDAERLAARAGEGGIPLTPDQLSATVDSVRRADFDVFSGAEDGVLRRLTATVEVTGDGRGSDPDLTRLELTLTLTDVNEPQEIAPPTDVQPIGELLRAIRGDLSSVTGGGAGGSGAGDAGGSGLGRPQSPQQPRDAGGTEAYLECLRSAETAEAVQACAELIP